MAAKGGKLSLGEKVKGVKPEIRIDKPAKEHNFPKLLMFFGIIIAIIAVVDYLALLDFPRLVIDIILFFAGLWLFKLGLAKGLYKKRKEVLKRYI
jgi:hypothetical protein